LLPIVRENLRNGIATARTKLIGDKLPNSSYWRDLEKIFKEKTGMQIVIFEKSYVVYP